MGCGPSGQSRAQLALISSKWKQAMQRSSETIGTIAAALAKAQAQLVNPEKSLVGTIRSAGRWTRPIVPVCPAVERARHRAQDPKPTRDRDRADHIH
jgi:hypothetical protein